MTASVWVLEADDDDVLGVYSTEEGARFVAAAIEAAVPGATRVVETLLDPAVDELRAGMRVHRVLLRRDGGVEECDTWPGPPTYHLANKVRVWRRSKAVHYRAADNPDVLAAFVWARDDAHAIEIADGHRTRLLAAGEWPEVAP